MSTTRTTPATPSQVWQLLGEVSTWPAWAPVRSATLEVTADQGGDGLGAVRALRTATGTTRERVTTYVPDRHLGYVLLSGLPLEDYRSDVTLQPDASGGTVITWTSTFIGSWLWTRLTSVIVASFCRHLAKAAPRPAATSPSAAPRGAPPGWRER